MIAALRTYLALVLAVLACSIATPAAHAAAPAAECAPLDLSDASAVRAKADAVTDVFAGKVSSAQALSSVGGGAGRGGREDKPRRASEWQHTVRVTVPFRTDRRPGNTVLVDTDPVARGGLGRLEVGATYLFFVSPEQGAAPLVAKACSGTQLVRGLSSQLQSALTDALDESADDPAPTVGLTEPDGGTRSVPTLGRLAAPGAAVALIGVLGLVLVSRASRRRG